MSRFRVPRAPRRAFPRVLTLYVAADQDDEIRAAACAAGVNVCEYVRGVLALHLAQRAATERQRIRPQATDQPTRRAPVPFQIGRPTGQDAPPPQVPDMHGGPPLAWAMDATPALPPSQAAGWAVFRLRTAAPSGPVDRVEAQPGVPLIIDLWAPRAWLRAMVPGPVRLRLDPVDEHGRFLRSPSAFVHLPAAKHAPKAAPTAADDPELHALLMRLTTRQR